MINIFGDNVRKARKRIGMSQQELADRVFVSPQAVSKWERNIASPNPETIAEIARVLKVSTEELLGVNKEEKSQTQEINDHNLKFALFGTTDIDDETYESVKNFAKFAAEQKRKKREGR